jgi:hypothetical protein
MAIQHSTWRKGDCVRLQLSTLREPYFVSHVQDWENCDCTETSKSRCRAASYILIAAFQSFSLDQWSRHALITLCSGFFVSGIPIQENTLTWYQSGYRKIVTQSYSSLQNEHRADFHQCCDSPGETKNCFLHLILILTSNSFAQDESLSPVKGMEAKI